MPTPRRPVTFRVRFNDSLFADDLARCRPEGRRVTQHARAQLERDGVSQNAAALGWRCAGGLFGNQSIPGQRASPATTPVQAPRRPILPSQTGRPPSRAGARFWAKAIVRRTVDQARSGRSLCRQCSRATSADRIAKAIVPVGDIA